MPQTSDRTWFQRTLAAIVALAVVVTVFDVLRKTVFLGASWNYDYPAENFVYDPLAIAAFVVLVVATVVATPKLLDLDDRRFVLALYLLTLGLSVASFFATPEKSTRWMQPTSGYYNAAVYAAQNGPIAYFDAFHSIPPVDGSAPNRPTAEYLSSAFERRGWVPLNEHWADYAREIPVQKHGPIPPLLVAPAIAILGESLWSALVGNYLVAGLLPIISYLTYRELFPEGHSRVGALLTTFAPAFLVYQRYNAVAWDALTAVVVAASVYWFVRYFHSRERSHLALCGVFYSLAVLSKISTGPLVFAFVAVEWWRREASWLRAGGTFAASSLAVPLGLALVGYNAVMQLLFSIARMVVESGGTTDPSARASYLRNPLLNVLGPVYNSRLIGPALGVLVLVAVGRLLVAAYRERALPNWEWRWVLACLLPFLPFVFVLPGRTIARHLLPLAVLLGLVGLRGLEDVVSPADEREHLVTFTRVAVVATSLVTLVSL